MKDLRLENKICRKEGKLLRHKGAGAFLFRSAKTLSVALAIGIVLTACKDDNKVIPSELRPTGASEAYFSEGMSFPAEGGDLKLTFTVNEAWTANLKTETTQNWCFLSANDGEAGNVELTVSVTKNDELHRKAVITLAAGTLERTVTVKQSGADVVTVNVETAGTLPELIGEEDKEKITELTISGQLNGTDIRFLREMAGGGITSEAMESTSILRKVELTDVRIVAGGDYYFVDDSGNKMSTENDILSDYFFAYCTSLEEVTLPNNITAIAKYAFNNCSSLTSIEIQEGVTSIGYSAFSGCSNLTSIAIPESATNIEAYAFKDCRSLMSIVIPQGVTNIPLMIFSYCSNLQSVVLPKSVTRIEGSAFEYCNNLTTITIPEEVTYIGEGAFRDCRSLTSIIIPQNITRIEAYAFCDCSGLTSIVISEGIMNIGQHAFVNCSGLTSITIPEGVTNIEGGAFEGCHRLTSIVLPKSVTSIGSGVFQGCIGLTSITIPENVTDIGDGAFVNCIGLTSIVIPKGVTNIEHDTFRGCNKLETIVFPENMTSIGADAFRWCDKLQEIHLKGTEPMDEFSPSSEFNQGNVTLYIPTGSLAAYQQSPLWNSVWSKFKKIIEE